MTTKMSIAVVVVAVVVASTTLTNKIITVSGGTTKQQRMGRYGMCLDGTACTILVLGWWP